MDVLELGRFKESVTNFEIYFPFVKQILTSLTTKNTIIDKEYVKVKKDTFDSMNNVIKETKKVIEFQPKIEQLFNEANEFSKSHQSLERENQNMAKEIKFLEASNHKLIEENNSLKSCIKAFFNAIKQLFRKLLQIGNELVKDSVVVEIKNYYDNKNFRSKDVYDISKGTTKEDELFDYAKIPSYLKSDNKKNTNKKDDFEIGI